MRRIIVFFLLGVVSFMVIGVRSETKAATYTYSKSTIYSTGSWWWKKYYRAQSFKRDNYMFTVHRGNLNIATYWGGSEAESTDRVIHVMLGWGVSKTTAEEMTYAIGLEVPIEGGKISESIGGSVSESLTIDSTLENLYRDTLDHSSPAGYYQYKAAANGYEYKVNVDRTTSRGSFIEHTEIGKYMIEFIAPDPYIVLHYWTY